MINYLEGKDKEIMRQEDEINGIDIFPIRKITDNNLLRVSNLKAKKKINRS